MKGLKKILIFMILTACVILPVRAMAVSAVHAVLIDANSGRVLLEKDAYSRAPMASTTKIMTALVALECGNLRDIVVVSKEAADTEGSSMWLVEGERATLENLVYGLMLNSGNDAATAIAEHIAGSEADFAILMNRRAAEIGVKNTNFTNPHGLDDKNHYTTAYDLAMIAQEAMKNNKFVEIVGAKEKIVPWPGNKYDKTLKNHNKMLDMYDGANGVKTGFTTRAGRCLVTSAGRGSAWLIAVTLNAPDDWDDHTSMLDFAFANYEYRRVISRSDVIKTLKVSNSEITYLPVSVQEDLNLYLSNDELKKIKLQYVLPDTVIAPILKGQVVGELIVNLNGKRIESVQLISDIDIPGRFLNISGGNTDGFFENFRKISAGFFNIFS